MPPKQKTPGLKPISKDIGAMAQLDAWCRQQPTRCGTKDLKFLTHGAFNEFSTASLAKKMTHIFDDMFGPGNDNLKDKEANPCMNGSAKSGANALMAAARQGLGVEGDKKMAAVTPSPSASWPCLSVVVKMQR